MFESLTDRLSGVFRSLGGRVQLTEENIQDAMREVRLALLEADVNFKVVKDFTDTVKEKRTDFKKRAGERRLYKNLIHSARAVRKLDRGKTGMKTLNSI